MQLQQFEFDIKSDEECECGNLISLEEFKNIPFKIKRVYCIYGVDASVSRGAHMHQASNQVLICVHGSCEVLLDDGKEQKKVLLDEPNKGLLHEKMIWVEMHHFSKDCVLMVLSDSGYAPDDYVRDYDQFLELTKVDA